MWPGQGDRVADESATRKWVLNANDGVISTAGIMQGFAGAGAHENTVLFAALALMVTGGLSLAAAAYAEAAQDRAADLETVREEQRRLALNPAEQQAELRQHYEGHGLSPGLADEVAAALMRKDALAAQLETEHGMLGAPASAFHPWAVALRAAFGFVSGALPVTLAVIFAPEDWRLPVTVLVVAAALAITGLVSARAGAGDPMRSVIRAMSIGLIICALSYLAGNVIDIIDGFLPQIEIESEDGDL